MTDHALISSFGFKKRNKVLTVIMNIQVILPQSGHFQLFKRP